MAKSKTKMEGDGRTKDSDVVQKVKDADTVGGNDEDDDIAELMKQEIKRDTMISASLMAKKQRKEAESELAEVIGKASTNSMGMGLRMPPGTPSIIKDLLELVPEDKRADIIEKHSDQIFTGAMGGNTGHLQTSIYEQLMARNSEKPSGGNDQFTGIAAIMAVMNDASQANQRIMLDLMNKNDGRAQNGPSITDVAKLITVALAENNKQLQAMLGGPQNNGKDEALELLRKEIQDLKVSHMEEKYGEVIGSLAQQLEQLKSSQNNMGKAFEGLKYLQDAGIPVSTTTSEEMRVKNDYAIQMKKLELEEQRRKDELTARTEESKSRQAIFSTLTTLVGTGANVMQLSSAIKNGKNKGTKSLMERYK